MKKFILLATLTFSLMACNNNSNSTDSDADDNGDGKKEKKVTKRNLSVTEANAYNNLFFDSIKLENYISKNQIADSMARRMRSFYNARNYSYAWFSPDGLSEQARGFWNLIRYSNSEDAKNVPLADALKSKMDGLIAEESFSVGKGNDNFLDTELQLTQNFIGYARNNVADGYIKRKEMERFVPIKKRDEMELADSLVNKEHKDGKYYADVNEPYAKLMEQLKKHIDIAKNGGWPVVNASATKLKIGSSSPHAIALKKRLFLSGDVSAEDTTPIVNDALVNGIKNFQQRHGYSATGQLTDAQLKDMNVSVNKRIQQILINLGRMRWMVVQPKGQLILVNIPEYVLHVKEQDKDIFTMPVVVGKEGHNTMMFTGKLSTVAFAPYWNVPPSIVKKEILPAIQRNPDYLANNNMEMVSAGSVPVIRQLPGEKNALGKVKFLFPNSFDIYFHDTQAKALFNKDKRAYSHGCIRLSDPEKMANYVLKNQSEWTPEKINAAMNAGSEQQVKVKNPIPVLITYYTSWVDDAGLLHFAEDIYDHDKHVSQKMFINSL